MEMLVIALMMAVIFGLPVGGMRYVRYRRCKKYMRRIDQRVKNSLLSSSGYGAVSPDVLAMVKGHILKMHLLAAGIMTVMCVLFSLLIYGLSGLRSALCIAVLFAAAAGARLLWELHGLRDASSLLKVKAFVFMTKGNEATFAYYDMQRLEYRTASRTVYFSGGARIEAGKYVNLIVRRCEKGYKVIRILSF